MDWTKPHNLVDDQGMEKFFGKMQNLKKRQFFVEKTLLIINVRKGGFGSQTLLEES